MMQKNEMNLHICLICGSKRFDHFLEVKDLFLTNEIFQLEKCHGCGLLYTIPRPDANALPAYYESVDYTSHNVKERSLKNQLYRIARNFALHRKLKMIEKYVQKGRILDIGTGTGEFLKHCKDHGWHTTGIELNDGARKKATEEYGLRVLPSDEFARIENTRFDVITMWHVLEHLENPEEQFLLNYKMLEKGGLLVMALPNYESWDAFHYKQYWAAYDVPRHLFHFSIESVKLLSEKTGFKLEEHRPLKLDAYYISLLSEKYRNNRFGYYNALIKGLRSNLAARSGKFGYSSWVYLLSKK
jgi:2-polyprenyl-3-methyl-5-hydroxy-6-metoxy-1,4-benzoquinol methylase